VLCEKSSHRESWEMQDNIHDISERPSYRRAVNALAGLEPAVAREIAKKLIAKGDAHGYVLLGAVHEFGGPGIEPNYSAALQNYALAVEVDGSVEGVLGYARIKYLGLDSAPAIEEALCIYSDLAMQTDNHVAHYMAGKIILEVKKSAEDLDDAERHARKALALGNRASKGLLLQIAHRREHAVEWLRWSASILLDRFMGRAGRSRVI
jgi:TPR repeat protein